MIWLVAIGVLQLIVLVYIAYLLENVFSKKQAAEVSEALLRLVRSIDAKIGRDIGV